MYRPIPDYLIIESSFIEGLGLFTTEYIVEDIEIGITHIKDDRFEDGYIRTPLGGFINHSEEPNCETHEKEGIVYMKTIRDIRHGEELTLKYKWYNVSSSSISKED